MSARIIADEPAPASADSAAEGSFFPWPRVSEAQLSSYADQARQAHERVEEQRHRLARVIRVLESPDSPISATSGLAIVWQLKKKQQELRELSEGLDAWAELAEDTGVLVQAGKRRLVYALAIALVFLAFWLRGVGKHRESLEWLALPIGKGILARTAKQILELGGFRHLARFASLGASFGLFSEAAVQYSQRIPENAVPTSLRFLIGGRRDEHDVPGYLRAAGYGAISGIGAGIPNPFGFSAQSGHKILADLSWTALMSMGTDSVATAAENLFTDAPAPTHARQAATTALLLGLLGGPVSLNAPRAGLASNVVHGTSAVTVPDFTAGVTHSAPPASPSLNFPPASGEFSQEHDIRRLETNQHAGDIWRKIIIREEERRNPDSPKFPEPDELKSFSGWENTNGRIQERLEAGSDSQHTADHVLSGRKEDGQHLAEHALSDRDETVGREHDEAVADKRAVGPHPLVYKIGRKVLPALVLLGHFVPVIDHATAAEHLSNTHAVVREAPDAAAKGDILPGEGAVRDRQASRDVVRGDVVLQSKTLHSKADGAEQFSLQRVPFERTAEPHAQRDSVERPTSPAERPHAERQTQQLTERSSSERQYPAQLMWALPVESRGGRIQLPGQRAVNLLRGAMLEVASERQHVREGLSRGEWWRKEWQAFRDDFNHPGVKELGEEPSEPLVGAKELDEPDWIATLRKATDTSVYEILCQIPRVAEFLWDTAKSQRPYYAKVAAFSQVSHALVMAGWVYLSSSVTGLIPGLPRTLGWSSGFKAGGAALAYGVNWSLGKWTTHAKNHLNQDISAELAFRFVDKVSKVDPVAFHDPDFLGHAILAWNNFLRAELAVASLAEVIASTIAVGAAIVGLAFIHWALVPVALLPPLVSFRWHLRASQELLRDQLDEFARDPKLRIPKDILVYPEKAADFAATGKRGMVAREVQRAAHLLRGVRHLRVSKNTKLSTWAQISSGTAQVAGVGSLFALAAMGLLPWSVPVSSVMAVLATSRQFETGVKNLNQFYEHSLMVEMVRKFEREAEKRQISTSDGRLPADPEALEFNNVSFSVPRDKGEKKDIVDQINISIPRGKVVALVGASGSGKSTLGKLAWGFLQPSSGVVKMDDVNIHDVPEKVRAESNIVFPQELSPIAVKVRRLLAMGRPEELETSVEEMTEALRRVGADSVVENLKYGLDTFLDVQIPDGTYPSGGERQRLLAARALLAMGKNGKFLIADEPTSALDAEHTRIVYDSLRAVADDGGGVLLIAHDLDEAVKIADFFYVMDRGRVVEQGTHEELLRQEGGIYRKLWNLTSGGEVSDDDGSAAHRGSAH